MEKRGKDRKVTKKQQTDEEEEEGRKVV